MLINAVFFHILPVIRTKGRFSPGLATAVVLFLPLGTAIFLKAAEEGHLDVATGLSAFLGGALLMAYPVVMLHLKARPYFRQAEK